MLFIIKKFAVSFDHIDLLSLKPIDIKNIIKSVKKTRQLLILIIQVMKSALLDLK